MRFLRGGRFGPASCIRSAIPWLFAPGKCVDRSPSSSAVGVKSGDCGAESGRIWAFVQRTIRLSTRLAGHMQDGFSVDDRFRRHGGFRTVDMALPATRVA